MSSIEALEYIKRVNKCMLESCITEMLQFSSVFKTQRIYQNEYDEEIRFIKKCTVMSSPVWICPIMKYYTN